MDPPRICSLHPRIDVVARDHCMIRVYEDSQLIIIKDKDQWMIRLKDFLQGFFQVDPQGILSLHPQIEASQCRLLPYQILIFTGLISDLVVIR